MLILPLGCAIIGTQGPIILSSRASGVTMAEGALPRCGLGVLASGTFWAQVSCHFCSTCCSDYRRIPYGSERWTDRATPVAGIRIFPIDAFSPPVSSPRRRSGRDGYAGGSSKKEKELEPPVAPGRCDGSMGSRKDAMARELVTSG